MQNRQTEQAKNVCSYCSSIMPNRFSYLDQIIIIIFFLSPKAKIISQSQFLISKMLLFSKDPLI